MPKHHSPICVVITGGLCEEVTTWTGAMSIVRWNERETREKLWPETEVQKKHVPSGQVEMGLAREDPFR